MNPWGKNVIHKNLMGTKIPKILGSCAEVALIVLMH